MHDYKVHPYAATRLLWLALAGFLMQPVVVVGAPDETFAVLEVGTHTYTNVTVTTKAKNCIFILHAAGMTSIKVSQLPPDVQEKLGYVVARPPKPATNTAGMWVKRGISNLNVPQVKDLTKQLEQKWRSESAARSSAMGLAGPKLIVAVLGVVLLLYLFHCYCCMLICRKTGNPSGILVWLPVLQLLPLLRAAGMSGWWFLAYFVPVLNLVPLILWPLEIAKARGKSVWVGVLLLLPVTNLFAFLYLAFSDGAAGEADEGPEPKVMTLQTT
jgi:uncharacterized membrane protein YhaH (DUF805 family)